MTKETTEESAEGYKVNDCILFTVGHAQAQLVEAVR